MRSPRSMLLAFVTFIGGFYFFLEFLLPEEIHGFRFGLYHDQVLKGLQVISAMAIGLGILNILRVHGRNILQARKGYQNSLALLLGFFTVFAIQLVDLTKSEQIGAARARLESMGRFISEATDLNRSLRFEKTESAAAELRQRYFENPELLQAVTAAEEASRARNPEAFAESIAHAMQFVFDAETTRYQQNGWQKASHFVNDAFFVALGSAMFALLGFYIANAAYRSFRIRSPEAAVMMVAAVVVMLGQIPFGPIYISESLPYIRLWLLKNVSTPAFRAIFFGSMIAGLAMAIRMWLSLERGPLDISSESESKGSRT